MGVLCSVADSRPAMSEEARRRALEPFFTTKEALHLRDRPSARRAARHRERRRRDGRHRSPALGTCREV